MLRTSNSIVHELVNQGITSRLVHDIVLVKSNLRYTIYDNILFLMQTETVYAGFDDNETVTAGKC